MLACLSKIFGKEELSNGMKVLVTGGAGYIPHQPYSLIMIDNETNIYLEYVQI